MKRLETGGLSQSNNLMEKYMGSLSIWHWIVLLIFFLPAILGLFVFKQIPVDLVNKQSGLPKTGRVGWSWTYFYIGFFVPLVRGEIGIAVLHFILNAITLGLSQLILSFLYNRQQLSRLMSNGWVLDERSARFEEMRHRLNVA